MPARSRYGYFLIALAVLVVDQSTKLLAQRHLSGRTAVEVIPGFFDLSYSLNRGGLFGYFRDLADPWRALLLGLLPAIAVVLIAVFLARSGPLLTRQGVFVLPLAGDLIAARNRFSRLQHGVVDRGFVLDQPLVPGAVAVLMIVFLIESGRKTFSSASDV